MAITTGIDVFPVDSLVKESGRSNTQILDDMCLGRLRASIFTDLVEGDDHITRRQLKEGYYEPGELIERPEVRVIWISKWEVAKLREDGHTEISRAEYPTFFDCVREFPSLKRYKAEIVNFPKPYLACLSQLRVLDADFYGYVSTHTGVPVSRSAIEMFTPSRQGGSYYLCIPPNFAEDARAGIPKVSAKKSTRRMLMQLILDHIVQLDLNPMNLERGKSGSELKGAIFEALVENHPSNFVSKNSFDKAWQDLRKEGHIVDFYTNLNSD